MAWHVTIELRGKLERLRLITSGADARSIRRIFDVWNTIYARFIKDRFRRASKGDGTWKKLKPATLKAKKKRGGLPFILRDTDLLFEQTRPTFAGISLASNDAKFEADIVLDPQGTYDNGATVSEVMQYHQAGGGRLPQRKIIVPPNRPTQSEMAAEGKDILVDAINEG